MARELKSKKSRKHVLSKALKESIKKARTFRRDAKTVNFAVEHLPWNVVCPKEIGKKLKHG